MDENWLNDVCAENDVGSDVIPGNQVDEDDEGLGLDELDGDEINKEFVRKEKK